MIIKLSGKLLILLLICMVLMAGTVYHPHQVMAAQLKADREAQFVQEQKLKAFEAAAERLYTAMQQVDTTTALREMDLLIDSIEGLSFKGLTSVEGIHALAETILDTRETMNSVSLSQEEWALASAKLRLAVNSLIHQRNPLWQQYYKVMLTDLQDMRKARAKGNRERLVESLSSLKSYYELIRPAALIQREASSVTHFESWLSYMEELGRSYAEAASDQANEEAVSQAIEQGQHVLKELFGRKGTEPVFLPISGYQNPAYWSILIGGWILLALAYTAMRKYQAEQDVAEVSKPPRNGGGKWWIT